MRGVLKDNRVEWAVRLLLGVVFIYASGHKILDPAHFAKIIYGYYLFPENGINLIAIILPLLELLCGMALVLGIYPRSAALLINIMLLAFIVAISINLIRGHEFDCGCFSLGDAGYTSSASQLLVRDIICFVFGLYIMFYDRKRKACLKQTGGLVTNLV